MIVLAMLPAFAAPAWAQDDAIPSTADRPMHGESAAQHDESAPRAPENEPAIPPGMTLDEVFDFAESPPPADFPEPVPDDRIYVFTLFEQLEYRVATDEAADQLGWEAQGWIGGDFNKFWWKNEGEAVFEGPDEGETETDLLYSRLVTPFWNFQAGVQYANEWHSGDYEDRWSGVIALQGLAPYMFELDNSLYISEDGDVTLAIEAEYDLRITQRLVLQPRTEMGFAFQDIPERSLGAGMTDVKLDVRLRYEIKREFAAYFGVRSQFLVGDTDRIAEANGEDSAQLFFMAGFRFAFL
ncbi:copper resistance protein B [Wenzhouxiangella sp. XN24]|uniref:copper resistance protein B n=1 Tax=Wenzhouxiangella sp. XN24 TaxID=2713569 RepID=UPI0013EC639E|nr:copper resistance protein B [Wenzhouxiangella sp. XN24]NGX17106.1 copper resistance protein B [Wenzhouxiangella sp. XN24]